MNVPFAAQCILGRTQRDTVVVSVELFFVVVVVDNPVYLSDAKGVCYYLTQ